MHAGVLEFTADDGVVWVPSWMMNHMGMADGDEVVVRYVRLPPGVYVKFLLESDKIVDAELKARLESQLRNFTTLTKHARIFLPPDQWLTVEEVKPGDAIR